MEKLLSTIVVLGLIYYALKWIGQLLLKRFIRNVEKKFSEQAFYTNNEQKSEGEVTIDSTGAKRKTTKNGTTLSDELGGEYVEFEEIN